MLMLPNITHWLEGMSGVVFSSRLWLISQARAPLSGVRSPERSQEFRRGRDRDRPVPVPKVGKVRARMSDSGAIPEFSWQ